MCHRVSDLPRNPFYGPEIQFVASVMLVARSKRGEKMFSHQRQTIEEREKESEERARSIDRKRLGKNEKLQTSRKIAKKGTTHINLHELFDGLLSWL